MEKYKPNKNAIGKYSFRKIGEVTVTREEASALPIDWSDKRDPRYVVANNKALKLFPKLGEKRTLVQMA